MTWICPIVLCGGYSKYHFTLANGIEVWQCTVCGHTFDAIEEPMREKKPKDEELEI